MPADLLLQSLPTAASTQREDSVSVCLEGLLSQETSPGPRPLPDRKPKLREPRASREAAAQDSDPESWTSVCASALTSFCPHL